MWGTPAGIQCLGWDRCHGSGRFGRAALGASVVFVLLAAGCGGGGLVGKWEVKPEIGGEAAPQGVLLWTIEFNGDGTFVMEAGTMTMMHMKATTKGTYERAGELVTLQGTSEMYLDDGYSKGTQTVPYNLRLRVEGDELVSLDAPEHMSIRFVRKE